MSTWTPGRRRQQRTLETPFEGVPPHLQLLLWNWIKSLIDGRTFDSDLVREVGLEFRIPLHSATDAVGQILAMDALRERCLDDDNFFLDLVEYILANRAASPWTDTLDMKSAARELENLLELGNSAYKVNHDLDGLEMRTTPEVRQQVQAVVDSAGSAGSHLANAWNAAYSRTPDPVKSYSESIKAVEAALVGRISPQNTKATLGTMIRDVNSKPPKWGFAIADGDHSDGVGTVLGMMRVLWEGQTSRHGGPAARPETEAEAQAAVGLAATLVQFGVSGAFNLA